MKCRACEATIPKEAAPQIVCEACFAAKLSKDARQETTGLYAVTVFDREDGVYLFEGFEDAQRFATAVGGADKCSLDDAWVVKAGSKEVDELCRLERDGEEWEATHIVHWTDKEGKEFTRRVMCCDGDERGSVLYTKAEWEAGEKADWEFDEDGNLLFQGDVHPPWAEKWWINKIEEG